MQPEFLAYVQSIDARLGRIEEQLVQLRSDVTGLKVKVAVASFVISALISASVSWII